MPALPDEQIRTAVAARRDELKGFCQRLIRAPSLPDQEQAAQKIVADRLRALGLQVEILPVRFQAGVIASAVRLLLKPSEDLPPQGLRRQINWAIAIALAAAPLILWALIPDSIPGLPTIGQIIGELSFINLIVAVIPIGLGIAGVWIMQQAETRRSADGSASATAWQNVLRLEWLNNAFFYIADLLTSILRNMARVVEGEGGLLWTMVLVVIVIVLSSAAVK